MLDFSSIMLRFRDLSTPPGTTITEHQQIVDSKGFVWWGWWNKQGEKVPEEAFRAINKASTGKPLDVFLFDTGRNELHRAKLVEIAWNSQLDPVSAPDRTATPDYYGDSRYYAWFKLSRIESIVQPEGDLANWSYVRVDEFFDTKKSVFEAFYDKQILPSQNCAARIARYGSFEGAERQMPFTKFGFMIRARRRQEIIPRTWFKRTPTICYGCRSALLRK